MCNQQNLKLVHALDALHDLQLSVYQLRLLVQL